MIPRRAAGAMALPWSSGISIAWRLDDGRGWISRCIAREIEQRRLFPWIAVCFGSGILLFFQADGEPVLWAPLGAFGLCSAAGIALRRSMPVLTALIAFAALFAGFSAGVIRARSVAAPVLSRITITAIAGFIEEVEDRE
ncbi:MAG: competence protein ComEC, partial [Microvirga sp.]